MGYSEIEFEKDSVFLVTGGTGFIGSNLIEVLLKKGYSVRCLDDLSNGHKSNIEPFLINEKFTFIQCDITDFEVCSKAMDGVVYILHQAAWGSVPRSIEMPQHYEKVNVQGTIN